MIPEALEQSSSTYQFNSNPLIEYRLVIKPGEKALEKISIETQDFCNEYGEKNDMKTAPQITIARFFGKENMEQTLNRWIANICAQSQPFEIALNNYSGFPSGTIYIRIQDPAPINDLKQQIKLLGDFITSCNCPPLSIEGKPHLTIAKCLSKDIYDRALQEYSQKDFHESFIAEEIILLRKRHQFDTYTIVDRFRFSSR